MSHTITPISVCRPMSHAFDQVEGGGGCRRESCLLQCAHQTKESQCAKYEETGVVDSMAF